MRFLASLTFTLSLLLSTTSVYASPVCTVFSKQAQGESGSIITLKIGPGYGLNINFIPTKETIKKAWLDDISRIGLSFDGNLCQWSANQQESCKEEITTVIHSRLIDTLPVPTPHSYDRGTLLSVITDGLSGRKLYHFRLIPVSTSPECMALTIKPDSERYTPALPPITPVSPPPYIGLPSPPYRASLPIRSSNNNSVRTRDSIANSLITPRGRGQGNEYSRTSTVSSKRNLNPTLSVRSTRHSFPPRMRLSSIVRPGQAANVTNLDLQRADIKRAGQPSYRKSDASAAANGLVSFQNNVFRPHTPMWSKAQDAIYWLRHGASREQAAARAGLELKDLNKLIVWGHVCP